MLNNVSPNTDAINVVPCRIPLCTRPSAKAIYLYMSVLSQYSRRVPYEYVIARPQIPEQSSGTDAFLASYCIDER